MKDWLCGEDDLGGFGRWVYVVDGQSWVVPACSCGNTAETFAERKEGYRAEVEHKARSRASD